MIRNFLSNQFHRWANLHPFLRFLMAGILLVAIGMVSVKPAYRTFRKWRMERNLAAAQVAVEETRMQEARDLSLTVLRSGETNIEAFRILEKATARLRDPLHPDVAQALVSHPQGTDDDRLTGFLTMANDMPLGMVIQAWDFLPQECRVQPAFATAFARRLAEEKYHDDAIQVLQQVPEDARDVALRQTMARMIIRRGQLIESAEVQYTIAMELAEDGADLPGWLAVLEDMPVMSLQQEILGSLRTRLQEWTDIDPARVSLLQARLDCAWHWEERTNILDKAIQSWRNKAPHQLARLLTDTGNDKLLLDTFPGGSAAADPEILRLLLDAARRSGYRERMNALLDASGDVLTKPLKLSYRALAAGPAARNDTWRAAIAEARSDPRSHALVTLHRMARDAGLNELAEMAIVEAIRSRRGPLPAYQDLQTLCQSLAQTGREASLLEIRAIYLGFEPANVILLTDYAYLACLLDAIEPSKLLPLLETRATQFPKQLPIHITRAAVLLSDGQPAQAAAVLAPFDLENQDLPPAYSAVILASAFLNGKIPADNPRIRDFPWNTLSLAERQKFTPMLRADKGR